MSRVNRRVTSREFKLMLQVDRFRDREAGIAEFWKMVEFLAERQGEGFKAKDQSKEEERIVQYLDTPAHALRRNRFVVRIREEPEETPEERFKLTLKFRDKDRYKAAMQDLSVSKGVKGKIDTKFEEDVTPGFVSRFSHSTSIKQSTKPKFKQFGDLAELFPGIRDLEIPKESRIETVSDFTAHELFRKAGKIKFGEDPEVKTALSFWYLHKARTGRALVGEFSFDYDDEKKRKGDEMEDFPRHVVKGATRLFLSLQKQTGWFDSSSTTKTAYAYEAL